MPSRLRRAAIWMATIVAVLLFGWFARGMLLRGAIEGIVDLATGYRLQIGHLQIGGGRLALRDVALRRGSDPVFTAKTVDVDYVLRDLLPGSKRRYGLKSVTVMRPQIFVVRRADGSFNITIPKSGPTRTVKAPTPFVLHVRASDGSIEFIDAANLDPQARHVSVKDVQADASIDTGRVTRYRVRGALWSGGRAYPVRARAVIDQIRGFAMHRISVPDIPIRGLGNFLIDSGVALLQRGDLRDLDLRLYAIDLRPDTPYVYHMAGGARLADVGVKLDVLTQSVQGIGGSIVFDDDAIVTPKMNGEIGTTPLALAGGMYDFAQPKFKLAVKTKEDLRVLHRDFNFLRTEPLAGQLGATCMLEGSIGDPLILADAAGRELFYKSIPIRNFRATIAYHQGTVFAGNVRASVGGVQTRVAGRFLVGGKDVDSELALAADAPPGTMPYVDRIAPQARTHITVTGNGLNLLLDTHAVLTAKGPGQSVTGTFALSPQGVGELGAFVVHQPSGGVDGAFAMDRERGTSALWLNANGLTLYPANPAAVLPGVDLPPFPAITGRFDGKVAGVDVDRRFFLLGRGSAQRADFQGVPIAKARATFGGPLDRLALGGIDAYGEFGHFSGRGALHAPGFAFEGDLNGTLQGMRRWTGELGVHGNVIGPVTIVSNGPNTLVQTPGVRLSEASVHGVPLQHIAGTFSVEPSRIVVYAASADVAGGYAVARGDSQNGIRLSTSGIDAARLRGTGLPIERGSIVGAGDLRLSFAHDASPSFDGSVALQDGNVSGRRVEGSAKLRYADGALGIDSGTVALASALGFVHGTVEAADGPPRFDLKASIGYADVGVLARAAHLPLPYMRGQLTGDVDLHGTLAAPAGTASLQLPIGSVNGLRFEDLAANVALGDRNLHGDGKVTVGSTHATFGFQYGRGVGARIDADEANLADFNDYFPAAGTLAGTGSVHARFFKRNGVVTSSGSVDLSGLRYRALPFGHMLASWNGGAGKVVASLQTSGNAGSFIGGGSISVPSGTKMANIIGATRVDLEGNLDDLDLNVWLPALGYAPPVLGHVNASGSVRGRYPELALDFSSDMNDAVIGRMAIDRVHVAAAAQSLPGGIVRTQIRAAEVAIDGVDLRGSGSIGMRPQDPLSLTMDARTAHIHDFLERITGKEYDVDGSGDLHVAIGGTLSQPDATASFSLAPLQVGQLTIPSVTGSLNVDRNRLALRDAAINFPSGKLTLSGSVPLQAGPHGIPATLPLSFDVGLQSIGMSQFAVLAPEHTKLDGTLAGSVQVRGTVSRPQLAGRIDLTGGGYTGPFETQPITNVAAGLAFNETSVALEPFEATVGGGKLTGSGTLNLPGGYDARFNLDGVRLAFPGYGSFRGDGTLTLAGAPPGRPGVLGGTLTISDAGIPLADFFKAAAPPPAAAFNLAPATPKVAQVSPAAGLPIPPWLAGLGLDLRLALGNNVRIRSPILDIGGKGAVQIAGRLSSPTLDGRLEATPGGSLFLNRAFKLQEANVRFSPANGIEPDLYARATTQIAQVSGLQPIDVTVTAQGTIPDIKLSYASNPPYDEATIVGLLFNATALGASVGSINAFAPTNNILLPPNAFQQTPSGTFALSQEASSLINAQFTARLLAPVEQGLGSAFGLSDLAINVAPTGSVGVQARRLLGPNVSALYGTSLQYPYRMTFGLESRPTPETSVVFTAFTQQGLYSFETVKPDSYLSANPLLGSAADIGGTYGFSVNIQRRSH